MTKAEIAAQQFLDDYAEALIRYEGQGGKLNALARLAGVSGATVSDHKNHKKLTDPTFKMIFQIAHALLGKPPCKLTVEPTEIVAIKIKRALDKDRGNLIFKLAEVIVKIENEDDLKFVEAPIELLYRQLMACSPSNSDTSF